MNSLRQRHQFTTVDSDEEIPLGSPSKARDIHSIPLYWPILLLAVLLGLFAVVWIVDSRLPEPLTINDEKNDHPNAFITERARHDLRLLTSLGPRVAGSDENEVLAHEFIKREISFINQTANKVQRLELSTQVVTGAHYLEGTLKILAYANLQNIALKLHGQNSSTSLLVNAHYDSVPTSPGGSDDGINCAVMLEIIRKLSREPVRPKHNIIFLFNGAEETGMQAAHGFITQHPWAKESKVVINLEATGAGGKIILFQSGPEAPWLMKYYNRVPHPYAQAAGEEIFQSGLIPSDTDYRIFRDYGGLIGLDMAFFKQGYRYHTKYDDYEHIPEGSFQHVGDNTLSLVRDIANSDELSDPKAERSKTTFYDFLGLVMISYTQLVARILNYSTVLLSLGVAVWSLRSLKLGHKLKTLKYIATTLGAIFGGWILAILLVVLIALFLDQIGYAMSWYANPWLIFGLFAIPTIAGQALLLPLINHQVTSSSVKAQVQVHLVRLIWTLVLFIGTILNIRTTYGLTIPILFNALAFGLVLVLKWQHTSRKWIFLHLTSLIIPAMFLMYAGLLTLGLFIPVTGRMGNDKNADLLIGILTLIFTVVITSPIVVLASLIRNFKYFIGFLGIIFVINLIIVFTPLGFPYTGDVDSPAPERYWTLHTRRIIHSENGTEIKRDSGYFLLNMDRNSPSIVKNHVKDMSRARQLGEDCGQFLVCGLPLAHAKMMQIIKFSTWVSAGQPLIPEPTRIEVTNKTRLSPTLMQYQLSLYGPDRMAVYISPKEDLVVTKISLVPKVPEEFYVWNNRPLYVIGYICGKSVEPMRFTLEVKTPQNYEGVTTEIALGGIYVHTHRNRFLPHYSKFISDFPNWADVTPWLGSFESQWI